MEPDLTLSDTDKRSAAYNICVLGWVGSGIMVGSWSANPAGPVVGAVAGFLFARATCDAASRYVVDKLGQHHGPMTEQQFAMMKYGVKMLEPKLDQQGVLDVIERAAQSKFTKTSS